jgi:recombination protein RecA
MPSATQLRIDIERQLTTRIPGAFSPALQQLRRTIPLGISQLDRIFGGLSLGAVTELTGRAGSGRTALSLAAIAQATRSGHVAAWVDATHAFDPLSAAASGVLLDRLLWVRSTTPQVAQQAPDTSREPSFRAPHTDRVQHGGGSPHPRSEERGLPEAVNALLATPPAYRRDRITGTPGAPNRPLASAAALPRHRLSLRIEQAGTDRQPVAPWQLCVATAGALHILSRSLRAGLPYRHSTAHIH